MKMKNQQTILTKENLTERNFASVISLPISYKYEIEQDELKKQTFELKNKLDSLNNAKSSSESFIRAIRKFMTMQTLTPIVLQKLIEKIEIFNVEGKGKNRTQRLIIHYRFVGCIDLPSVIPKHTYKLDSRQGVAIEYLPIAMQKEKHAMHYTTYRGFAQVSNWVRLKFAAMNLKKFAKRK